VLVVDDNEDAAEVLAQLLSRASDLNIATACSGSQAIAAATERAPRVVILDLGLPDMDGYEVLAQMKRLSALQETVFIALTGRASRAEHARATAAGFHHYFVKPADLDALRHAVRAAAN